jgi:hypothetical protein
MPAAVLELHDRLGEIVIDNPPLNLFSEDLIADLRAAAEQAVTSKARAVVVRAEGEAFSGGADVSIFVGLDGGGATALIAAALSLIDAVVARKNGSGRASSSRPRPECSNRPQASSSHLVSRREWDRVLFGQPKLSRA